MRLFLSSDGVSAFPERLTDLVGQGARVLITENALDNVSADYVARYKVLVYDVFTDLTARGFVVEQLDLRDYFADNCGLEARLENADLVWATGGNTFLLRRAMRQSGLDNLLLKFLSEDRIAYGGWSAGACVASPSLRGIELCDAADDVTPDYDPAIIWDGLGLVDYSIVPHYRSDHPESDVMEQEVAYLQANNVPYEALADGDVIVVDGDTQQILRA